MPTFSILFQISTSAPKEAPALHPAGIPAAPSQANCSIPAAWFRAEASDTFEAARMWAGIPWRSCLRPV
eukprot:871313-Pelagomonas_calceolata.AAC.11